MAAGGEKGISKAPGVAMNCTPKVRQYGILKELWGCIHAKRDAEREVYGRVQAACNGDNA